MAYEIRWTDEAKTDMRGVPIFRRKPIFAAVALLEHQASIEIRHRKPLVEPLEGFPGGTWELRVGAYRILYWTEEDKTVEVLRVILKGSSTMGEAVARGRTS
jgi:mRNA-degrading endonuclease RelE of RelBE toxin-antitoxin system